MCEIYEELVSDLVDDYVKRLAESIIREMVECEDSYIVNMGNNYEPNELWVFGSVINGYDTGVEFDQIRDAIESRIQEKIDALPVDIQKVIFAWNEENEDYYEQSFTKLVFREVHNVADSEWMLPDEWGTDKYWWEFRYPLSYSIKEYCAKQNGEVDRQSIIQAIIKESKIIFKELSQYSVKTLRFIIQCDEVGYYDTKTCSTKDDIFSILLGHIIDELLIEYYDD